MNKLAALSGVLLAVTVASGQTRSYLNIGDPAPAMNPARWLKGEPIPSFQKGNVYVVEFWATWCGPCKENIPHLTEMAKKFKGKADILGVSIWESNDPTSSAYLNKVAAFVKAEGDQMNYHVAVDGPASTIGNTWMKAAGEGGIPTSFVIGRDGKIAWIGHPANLESVLAQVVDDKFNVPNARAQRAMEVEVTRPISEAMEAKEFAKAIKLIDAFVAKKPDMARRYTYDRLVALYHLDPNAAEAQSTKILEESNHEIGAYRMVVSIFAAYKDLPKAAYPFGRKLCDEALAKNEMKYLFLAMSAEINSDLGDLKGAVKAQAEAVEVASTDPHAPKEFVDFLRKNLEKFEAQEKAGAKH